MTALGIIRHRVNRIDDLKTLRPDWGVEIDIRSNPARPSELYLQHDPWRNGDALEQWVEEFVRLKIRGTIIANSKEDGLEQEIIRVFENAGLSNFLFLDTTIPTLVKWVTKNNESRFLLRISRFETPDYLKHFAGKVNWVWADCFDGVPLSRSVLEAVRQSFKICLVSPELQGLDPVQIESFKSLFSVVDAVCTKHPERWATLANP